MKNLNKILLWQAIIYVFVGTSITLFIVGLVISFVFGLAWLFVHYFWPATIIPVLLILGSFVWARYIFLVKELQRLSDLRLQKYNKE